MQLFFSFGKNLSLAKTQRREVILRTAYIHLSRIASLSGQVVCLQTLLQHRESYITYMVQNS